MSGSNPASRNLCSFLRSPLVLWTITTLRDMSSVSSRAPMTTVLLPGSSGTVASKGMELASPGFGT